MELLLNEIRQMDNRAIYKRILPTINNIYEVYKYLSLTREEYDLLVEQEIGKSKKEYDGKGSYSSYIKKRISLTLLTKLK